MKTLIIGMLLTISPLLMAQQVVTGRITDATDGEPVPGASIFIANTTIGTASDAEGNYSFTVPGRGSLEIVVSHVSYQSVFHKIDVPQDRHQFDAALEIIELDEVVVNAGRNYRRSDVNLFWRMILGESPSRRGMEVLNEDKVYFYLNSDKVLKVICREPVEIINHHTGYRIRFILKSFEHDYRTNETVFDGMPSFEELIPRNSREQELWEKKRQEVYAISVNRFLRALYRKQINEEGFLLADRDTQRDDGKIVPVLLDNMLTVGRDETLVNLRSPVLLLCYSKPVTSSMILDGNWHDILQNDFQRFTPSMEGGTMSAPARINYSTANKDAPIVVELRPTQFTIYPDGTYNGTLYMGEINKYMGGLSSKLPVEYPETAVFTAIKTDGNSETNYSLSVEENIIAGLVSYPQEKIHLHTDRDFYIPGEKMRFKAYVVDANSHLQPLNSLYMYVELIGPANTLVNRVMITQTDDDMFYGYLPVSDVIPEGNYTLRAYTRHMENMGDDYFFKKNIRIGALTVNKTETGEQKNRINSPLLGELEGASYDISFFPEGGNYVAGVSSKVAFKALNKDGYPETISGTLIDNTGAEITSVKTFYAGMGVIEYLPEAGKRYRLKCKNETGLEKLFDLPQPNARSRSLTVSSDNNNLLINVQHADRASDISCYLLAHCRGEVIYFSEWDGRQAISLPEEELPAGVIQIMLFDRQMNPLSERLVFSKNNAVLPIEFHADKEIYRIRDKIVSTLSFPDSLLYAYSGNFSVAVTDDKDIAIDESVTILSSLLLSSELRGYIENPAWYLLDTPAAKTALDLLMMTHGWRRYNIPEVVKGRMETPRIPFQQFQEISGQVNSSSRILSRPVRDSEILITVKGGGLLTASTDANGFFAVPELDFPDSTTFYIQALTKDGGDNVRLTVNNESFPTLVYAPQSPASKSPETEETDVSIDAFMQKAEQRAKFDEDIWMLQLDEVTVTAQRITKREGMPLISSPDQRITQESIKERKYPSVIDYIAVIPGIRNVRIEGGSLVGNFVATNMSFGGDNNILVLIDGMDDMGGFEGLKVDDIKSIDVFNGVSATAYGTRGANGVISITTGAGGGGRVIQSEKPNRNVYTPLGYQEPVEFYSPKYESLEARQSNIPDYRTTIFWKPDVVISDEGKATFEFYTSDFPTTYSVVIEGLTKAGNIVRQVEKIQVR